MRSFFRCEESGQAMVEYTIIIALIAIACIFAFGGVGNAVRDFIAGDDPQPGPPDCEVTHSCEHY